MEDEAVKGRDNNESLTDEQILRKGRHRKKQLFNSILQQMEFYFSDSNLTKDRFLSQLLAKNSNVDINVFLNFNKIRKLTSSIEDIQKAVKNSSLITLSEDKTSVCRKQPVKEKTDVEECTIYVERLQPDATHEWVMSVFSEFGNVLYISIPKYKHSGLIKGFAFVEFDKELEAKKALSYFESIGCKMPSNMEPEQLYSIKTFESDTENVGKNGNETRESNKKQINTIISSKTFVSIKSVENKQNNSVHENKLKSDKRKLEEGKENEEIKAKRMKEEVQTEKLTPPEKSECTKESDAKEKLKETQPGEKTIPSEGNKKRKIEPGPSGKMDNIDEPTKKQKLTEAEHAVKEVGEVSESEDSEIKKKKKLKKDNKKKNLIKELGLQVLSKKEWKKMRNRYLDLQKKKMKEFKKHLYKTKYSQANYEDKSKQSKDKKMEQLTQQKQPVKDSEPKHQFIEGVIVKMSLDEPVTDVKNVKNVFKAMSPEIKYIDTNIGSQDVHLRFGDTESAKKFCAENSANKRLLLTGDAEKAYWKKLHEDRETKMKKTNKKQRGRDKLLKKAKHTKFDDRSAY